MPKVRKITSPNLQMLGRANHFPRKSTSWQARNWSQFTFHPEFDSKKRMAKCKQHSLPTGAIPVPQKDGKCKVNGWQFQLKLGAWLNWCRIILLWGKIKWLDPWIQKRMPRQNYTKQIRIDESAHVERRCFFFLKLLLPVCDPKSSGIEEILSTPK
jgi:hypothetical protein